MDITRQIAMLFSLIGATCIVLSGFAKSSHKTHKMQVLDCSAHTVSNILLEGYSGALATAVSLIRELIAANGKMTDILQYCLCGLIVVPGVICNDNGFVGLLPVIASVQYTIIGCRANASFTQLKIALLISIIMWAIYDLYMGAYPSFVADVITAIMCITSLKSYQNKCEQQSADC